jgi:hypothetical protein
VTGQVELRTKEAVEIEHFVAEHLRDLVDHTIAIRLQSDGQYLAEFYSSTEAAT